MPDPYDESNYPYPNNLLPAFTEANQQQRSEPANVTAMYRPNPAFRPPRREPVRHNVYDIPDAEDVPPRPPFKKRKRGEHPAISTTPLSLSQTTTPPESKEQMRKTSRPSQAKNIKSFPNTTVSKASFSQNRSHCNSDKSSSNLSSKPPAAKEQFGIAMTTMEKLAAFRYQPSSTGSIHKVMASSRDTLGHPDQAKENLARSPSAKVVPSREVVQASGNKDYDSYQNSAVANAEVAHSLVPELAANTAQGGSHITLGQLSEDVPSSVQFGRTTRQNFFASILSNVAASTAPSTANVTENNSEYDDGDEGGHIRGDLPFHDPASASKHASVREKPSSVTEVPQQAAQALDLEYHYQQPPPGPDDDILNYENFDDLTMKPWNHMDYVARANQDAIAANHSEHTEERLSHMDLNIAQGLQPIQTPNDYQETALYYVDTGENPADGVKRIVNADLSTGSHKSSHGQTTVPGEDDEDYFAALEDFDDKDFEDMAVPPSSEEAKVAMPPNHSNRVDKSVPEREDEDYLAAFGELNDDDFMDIEVLVPSGHNDVFQHQKGDALETMLAPELPATQHGPAVKGNNHLETCFPIIAASLLELPHNAHGDTDNDECPLDEDAQAELEHLRISKHRVVCETNEPPSSIFHSEEDMRDMEIYDRRLKYSPVAPNQPKTSPLGGRLQEYQSELDEPLADPEDWEFLRARRDPPSLDTASTLAVYANFANAQRSASAPAAAVVDDEDHRPLPPFARPPFPGKVSARSPVAGISSNLVLRTCFRIGEALSQASLCSRDNQNAVTELFARVTFSAREADGKTQNFQFGDIFHNKPPSIGGVLEKYASSELQQTESSELVTTGKERRDGEVGEMVRVLGRVKRVIQGRGYTMEIINIRKTDWEEVRFTKRILGAEEVSRRQ